MEALYNLVDCPRCMGRGKMPALNGPEIKRRRLQAKWSQLTLSVKLGCAQSFVCDVELGGKQMSWPLLRRLQELLP